MIAVPAVLILHPIMQVPMPPYKRIETISVFETTYDPGVVVQGTTFYAASGDSCFAYDLATGKRLWELKVPDQYLRNLDISGTTLYALSYGDEAPGKLLAIDAKSGGTIWSLPRTGDEWALATNENTIFACLKPNSISAVDSKTRTTKWTVDFPKPEEDTGGVDAITIHKDFVLVCANSVTYCFDKSNGKSSGQRDHPICSKRHTSRTTGLL